MKIAFLTCYIYITMEYYRGNLNFCSTEKTLKIKAVISFVLTLLLLLAFVSYNKLDSAILSGGAGGAPHNWIGHAGAWISVVCFHFFGLAAYLVPLLLLLRTLRCFVSGAGKTIIFCSGAFLILFGSVLLFGLAPEPFCTITDYLGLGRRQLPQLALSGGALGQVLASPAYESSDGTLMLSAGWLRQFIGAIGTMVVGLSFLISGLVVIYINDWHILLFGRINNNQDAPEEPRRRSFHARNVEREQAAEDVEDNEPSPKRGGSRLLDFLHRGENAENTAAAAAERRVDRFAQERLIDEPEPEQALSEIKNPASPLPRNNDLDAQPELPVEAPAAPVEVSAAEPREVKNAPAPEIKETPKVNTRPTALGERAASGVSRDFVLPPVTMLAQGSEIVGENSEAIERSREILQRTLEDFNIMGRVSGYISGPRVTRFEITLDPGVNVKKVEQIQDNIAMNLSAQSVRVLAPIPGRPVVGIEVSNSKPEAVHMRSVMESEAWKNTRMDIPLAVGKDVSGKPVVFDLAKAPHLLIAGTTGTGKSVCTNSLIVSLLFRFAPDELKLIMVDPKVVEFEDYKRLPHLLTPIINDSSKVPIALRWAVNEMERRYRQLAAAGVKKLAEYNSRPITGEEICTDDGQPIPDRLPYLVVIIDELADLMMTEAKKDAETSIVRIAQKGRAAGIHLILATQRPSTNIITGVIKGNLPSRFCFQVRSMIDSRVVLDTGGAEKLLGMGDMLLMSPTSMNIERVQGAFVRDPDIKSIVKFVSDQAPQHFNDTVLIEEVEIDDEEESQGGVSAFDEDDVFDEMDRADIAPVIKKYSRPGDSDLFKRALEVVLLDRKASTSYFQRRLKIGYNTAATITQELEDRGIIGPDSGSGKKRDILIFDGMEINQS